MEFSFFDPSPIRVRSALRYVLYGSEQSGIPKQNKIKMLLLGHDNAILKNLQSGSSISPSSELHLSSLRNDLDHTQLSALRSSFSTGDSIGDFMTLIAGPPGSGKKVVSAHIAAHCHSLNEPALVICESDHALNVIAGEIERVLSSCSPSVSCKGIYRLDADSRECRLMQMGMEDTQLPLQSGNRFTPEEMKGLQINPPLFRILKSWIEASCTVHRLSLGKHIISRLEMAQSLGPRWPEHTTEGCEEYTLMFELIERHKALTCSRQVLTDILDPPTRYVSIEDGYEGQQGIDSNLFLGLQHAWMNLQEFYLRRAKVVLWTASAVDRIALSSFKPTFIVVGAASQMTESSCLNGFIRHYPSTKKIILIGDTAQLPPLIASVDKNEFLESEKLSLFERLIKSGHPTEQLQVQYRMHPDIGDFVSREFYEGSLINHGSCLNRRSSVNFQTFMEKSIPQCTSGSSYFISVENSSLWKRTGQASLFNPEYVSSIVSLADRMITAKYPQEQILVISYYREERQILTQLLHRVYGFDEIMIQSVDGSARWERDIVLLSTSRPWGEFGLGFVADRQRQCVAMSRARDGLIIFGDQAMGDKYRTGGFQSWRRLVEHHRRTKRLHVIQGSRRLLEDKLDIPNSRDFAKKW